MRTIAWDVDDVLNSFERTWLTDAPDIPKRVPYPELVQNPPHDIVGMSREAYATSLDAFRGQHYPSIPPDPAVLGWFQKHGHQYRHIAISAPPLALAHLTTAWVMRHFGDWIRTTTIVPSHRPGTPPGPDATKGDHLAWLGSVDLFIDDTPKNLASAHAFGITTLTAPQPWNKAAGQDLIELLGRSL